MLPVISDEELITHRIALLFRCDPNGYLLGTNEPIADHQQDAPLVYLCWGHNTVVCGYRDDVSQTIQEAVATLIKHFGHAPPLSDRSLSTAVCAEVNTHQCVRITYEGPAYRFRSMTNVHTDTFSVTPDNVDRLPTLQDKQEAIAAIQPYVVKLVDGQVAASCCTVRRTGTYLEAGVETVSHYRRHGYGKAVVVDWATKAIEMGCVPLYSTSWDNTASVALAKSIGLIQYGTECSIG